MNWKEIEETTLATIAAEEEEKKKLASQSEEELTANRNARVEASRERARVILEDVHAREILEAVRDQVWEEGDVRYAEFLVGHTGVIGVSRGYTLTSKEFSLVDILYNDKTGKPHVKLKPMTTALSVYITPDYENPDHPVMLEVADQNMFNIVRARTVDVSDAIRSHGLREGLREAEAYRHSAYGGPTSISVTDPEKTFDIFRRVMVTTVNSRKEFNSLPKDIRSWTEAVVSKFPSALKDKGSLSSDELGKWAGTIRGSLVSRVFARPR